MNLSNHILTSSDTEHEVSLWDLPIVSEGEAAAVISNVEAPILLPTAEDIENIQKQAYKEAYDEAFQKAKTEGFEQGKKEGHEKGYDAGKTEGFSKALNEGRQVNDEKLKQFTALVSTLASPLDKLDHRVEDELVTLAMLVARHLIRRELKQDPSHVIAAIRQAVNLLPVATQNIVLFLHPDDLVLVRDSLSIGEKESEDELRWKMIEDPMLTRGGCKIETSYSRIDASVESQINAVIAQVLGGERGNDNGNMSRKPQ